MRLAGRVVQVGVAFLLGGLATLVMLVQAVGPEIRITSQAINAVLLLGWLGAAFFVALVCACDRFSRHVESRLAAFRAAKRSWSLGWTDSVREEERRLDLLPHKVAP